MPRARNLGTRRVRKTRLSSVTHQVNEWRAKERFCAWLQKQGYVTIVRMKRKRKDDVEPSIQEQMAELVDVVAFSKEGVVVAMVRRQPPSKPEEKAFRAIPVAPAVKKMLAICEAHAREPLVRLY